MTDANKITLLSLLSLISLTVVFLLPPMSQSLSFHHFADDLSIGGIPNFYNVVTNIPFLIIGITGISMVTKSNAPSAIRVTYALLFIGVLLVGLGSAYYHQHPDNDTLVWDRLPMTIVFMSFLSATLSELVSPKAGFLLLFPLIATGIFSVFWWHYTESLGRGDLRLYMWVQYFPMLAIPLLLGLYYSPAIKPIIGLLLWIVAWYAIAKALEQLDYPIYHTLKISGHSLKHLAAAMSTIYFILLFRQKYVPASPLPTTSHKR